MRKVDPHTALATLAFLAVVGLLVGVPEAFDRGVEAPLAQVDKALGLPTATPAALPVRPTVAAMPVVVPVEAGPIPAKGAPDSGKHILGGRCPILYATSVQNLDLVCSKDCGGTWRSKSNPGVCYPPPD